MVALLVASGTKLRRAAAEMLTNQDWDLSDQFVRMKPALGQQDYRAAGIALAVVADREQETVLPALSLENSSRIASSKCGTSGLWSRQAPDRHQLTEAA